MSEIAAPSTRLNSDVEKRMRDVMSSRALLLRLRRLHYEYAPKSFKDKHLPVLYVAPKPKFRHRAKEAIFLGAPEFSMEGFDPPEVRPLRAVIAVVSHYYRKPKYQILGRNQSAEFVKPRHVAMYLATEFSDMSMAQISRHFNRDHTVILHARRSILGKMATDEVLALQIDTLKKQIAAMSNIPSVDHVARLREAAAKRCRPYAQQVQQ